MVEGLGLLANLCVNKKYGKKRQRYSIRREGKNRNETLGKRNLVGIKR